MAKRIQMTTQCLFCKIVAHDIPSKIRFENDNLIAFDDIKPEAKTHILIVPKKHIDSVTAITDNDRDLIAEMIFTARDLTKEQGIDQSGYRLTMNTGKDAGQTVDHLHLHLIGGEQL